jgi:hypothetical protein
MQNQMNQSELSFGIHCAAIRMQGIAIAGIIHPQKSLSVVHSGYMPTLHI